MRSSLWFGQTVAPRFGHHRIEESEDVVRLRVEDVASLIGQHDSEPRPPCPCCGGRMIIIETFERGCSPRTRPVRVIRIDTS
jgi:hypothetical protein